MKSYLFLLGFITLLACSSESSKPAKIKTERRQVFSTKIVNNQLVKDSLQTESVIGLDTTGSQCYFLGVKGYPINNDTSWMEPGSSITKVEGNKHFHYDHNKLTAVSIRKGDTLYQYSGADLTRCSGYLLTDDKGTKARVDFLLEKKEEYLDRKFDAQGNLIYCIQKETYVPSEFHLHEPEGERLEKEANTLNNEIIETTYEYY